MLLGIGTNRPLAERSIRALMFAKGECIRLNHSHVGPDHILLGLIENSDSSAARVLSNLGVDLGKLRDTVLHVIGQNRIASLTGEIGLTPRAKEIVRLAEVETPRFCYIGTAHLLIGLLHAGQSAAAGVLENLGVTVEKVRVEFQRIVDEHEGREAAQALNSHRA